MPCFLRWKDMNHFIKSDYKEKDFEKELKDFIEMKFSELNLSENFPNLLIKEDVLNILDKYCTVIYYPLTKEINNGFHITNVPCGGKICNFVFINTAQTMEKQVFTAAHELGHIWDVDEYLINKMHLIDEPSQREAIINRFAAILLMPEESFKKYYSQEIKKYSENGRMAIFDLYKVIVSLMNYFFVPIKSVIFRLVELELIMDDSIVELLLGNGPISEEKIQAVITKLLQDYGCDKFIKPSEKKWIDGLAEILDKAEKEDKIPNSKIQKLREMFELEKASIPQQMTDIVDIPQGKENS